ncbi:MAG: 16S rRNA (uracil(1498)-N(3))-methyltransferase [Woeseia sp.]
MSTPRLFTNEKLAEHGSCVLRGEAARYIGRVLRSRPGDALILFDGSGPEFAAVIAEIGKQEVRVTIAEATQRQSESPLAVHLLQGISKGERMDTVVQKTTELGVRRITPLQTEFSVVKLSAERAAKRQQHWQRIGESACEQCGRSVPPAIDAAMTLQDYLQRDAPSKSSRLILLPGAERHFANLATPSAGIELMVGPEGGFSAAEQELASARGFVPIGLGPRVLRTETAAIAALALVQSLWGDLAPRTPT